MNSISATDAFEYELGMARQRLGAAHRITVLTGAGISTDSGIPDFRGPNGVWTKNPEAEKLSTLQNYLNDPDVRRRSWQARITNPAWVAGPNAGHRSIAALNDTGRLHALITQNIDGLHQAAGVPGDKLIEVHGTMRLTRCWRCDDVRDMRESLERVEAGDPDPACELCGGILKSDTISFGQSLVPEVIDAAFAAASSCDAFVAIGSTLQVYPVARCVPIAKAAGAYVVIVNGDETAFDQEADALLTGDISTILAMLFEPAELAWLGD